MKRQLRQSSLKQGPGVAGIQLEGAVEAADFFPVGIGDRALEVPGRILLCRWFWPNDADFDPETLHDWPRAAEELASMVQRWSWGA